MGSLLLTVDDSFEITGRGTIVLPPTSPEAVGAAADDRAVPVRLVRPDGTAEVVTALFAWEHFNPGGYRFVCSLFAASREQVPPGRSCGCRIVEPEG